jgi:hypothetical protein
MSQIDLLNIKSHTIIATTKVAEFIIEVKFLLTPKKYHS